MVVSNKLSFHIYIGTIYFVLCNLIPSHIIDFRLKNKEHSTLFENNILQDSILIFVCMSYHNAALIIKILLISLWKE